MALLRDRPLDLKQEATLKHCSQKEILDLAGRFLDLASEPRLTMNIYLLVVAAF